MVQWQSTSKTERLLNTTEFVYLKITNYRTALRAVGLMWDVWEQIGINGLAIEWEHFQTFEIPKLGVKKSPFKISAKQVTIVMMTKLIAHKKAPILVHFSSLSRHLIYFIPVCIILSGTKRFRPPPTVRARYDECSCLRSYNFTYEQRLALVAGWSPVTRVQPANVTEVKQYDWLHAV